MDVKKMVVCLQTHLVAVIAIILERRAGVNEQISRTTLHKLM